MSDEESAGTTAPGQAQRAAVETQQPNSALVTGTAPGPVPGGHPGQVYAPVQWGYRLASGKTYRTGLCLFLIVITFGIYLYVWTFRVHDQMKRHSGEGIGGGVALLLALTVGFVLPFVTSGEVGRLYQRNGLHPPVSGVTGCWYLPGLLIGIGPIVWFVKTNNALNRYWELQRS